jgi:NTE family protein
MDAYLRPTSSVPAAMRLLAVAVCTLAAAHAATALAVETAPAITQRPKIALVLSGGGARGGAHLGVLKVLDELRVPVDMVVGTSIGSIVGAAYATGMPLSEIEQEMKTLSTANLFRDVVRRDLPMARKGDEAVNYIGPEVGLGPNGLMLPKGAIAGVALEGVLRRLTVGQRTRDFDRLPVPFRAVATDVTTAEMVVLSHGNLATAVRASMAVPAAINPVEIDGRLLVDGGIARNLPVDVARSLGAQIIIAVDIGTPLLTRSEITSVLSVSEQMTRVLTVANTRESRKQIGPDDILVTPDLAGIGAASFDMLAQAQAAGEAAARAAAPALQRHALAPAAYAAHEAFRIGAEALPKITVAAVRIEGAHRVPESVLQATLQTRPGDTFDAAVAESDMRRLYGRGDFEHVSYALSEEPGVGHVMTTTVHEKSWGPQYLRLGLGMSTGFSGDSFFSLHALHRWTWLNTLGGEWRNDLAIGHADRLRTEWLQPLTRRQRLFVAGHVSGERIPFDLYDDGARMARFRRQDLTVGIDLGAPLAEWGEVRVGVARGRVKLLTDTSFIPGSLLVPNAQTAGVTARLRLDTLDNVRFPRSGMAADLRLYSSRESLGADRPYTKLSFVSRAAVASGPHSLQAGVEVEGKVGSTELPDYELVTLGGFLRLSGYRTGELLGRGLRFARVIYNYRISQAGFLDGTFVGVSTEIGRISDTDEGLTTVQRARGHAVYVAVDTPLGPLYLGYGRASSRNRTAYLLIGQP